MRRLVTAGVVVFWAVVLIAANWSGGPPAAQGADDFRIEGAGNGTVVEVNLVAEETTQTIAKGVSYQVWTFNGTAPGPVIRVGLGDTVRFTLENRSSHGLSHSIDFHAAQTPWDVNYQAVGPGETFSFDWVARFPGVFMYHCGVPPVLMHIANGMYGAIIVEPDDLAPAREYVMVSSEFYPGKEEEDGAVLGSLDRMESARPTLVEFDGGFNRYLDAPLVARPNELIRLWVVNAGPTLENAFHVIGALFDHVYPSGNPTTPLNGVQTYGIPPGDGAMFEMRIPDEGVYPFVTHAFAYTGLGALGAISIDAAAPAAPGSYPVMADPFTAGVAPATAPSVTAPSAAPSSAATATVAPSGGGTTLALDAAISGFDPATAEVAAGDVTFTIANADAFPHDFTIDEVGLKIPIPSSGTATDTVSLEPGTYRFYCSIPGHADAGMEGTLTVS